MDTEVPEKGVEAGEIFFQKSLHFQKLGDIISAHGLVAQLGAHHIRIVGVESSNLFKSTRKKSSLSIDKGDFFEWCVPLERGAHCVRDAAFGAWENRIEAPVAA